MARLVLTPQNAPGSYPTLPLTANSADFVFTAAGASFADGFGFPLTGRELLLVRNPTGGALTITINSLAASRTKRTGDITAYSVGNLELAVFGPFSKDGWKQADGSVFGVCSASTLELAVIKW